MKPGQFTIGVLSTTAVILFVSVLILNSRPDSAFADGMTESGGGYTMTVGAVTQDDEELVYVIHNGKARMIVYRFNTSQKQIELVEGIDLKEMRDSTSNTPGTSKPSPPTPRGSRKKP